VRGEFEGEGREAALVLAERGAVDPDGGGGHGAFEVDEDALAARGGWGFESAAIGRDELVGFVVEVVPGQMHVGVRNHDSLKGGVIEVGCVGAFDFAGMVAPTAIDGQDGAPGGGRLGGERGHAGQRGRGEEGAGGL